MTPAQVRDAKWKQFLATRDPQTRDWLIEDYRGLIFLTARRMLPYDSHWIDRDDLTGAGMIGLIRAVDRFDPSLGFPFETLAIDLIRGSLRDWLRREDPMGRTFRTRQRALIAMGDTLHRQRGQEPSEEECAAALGWSAEDLALVKRREAFSRPSSLDVPGDSEDEDDLFVDTLVSDTPPLDTGLLAEERSVALKGAIEKLTPRQQVAITRYYLHEEPIQRIAAVLNVTESRVYQLLRAGCHRMRVLLAGQECLFE